MIFDSFILREQRNTLHELTPASTHWLQIFLLIEVQVVVVTEIRLREPYLVWIQPGSIQAPIASPRNSKLGQVLIVDYLRLRLVHQFFLGCEI